MSQRRLILTVAGMLSLAACDLEDLAVAGSTDAFKEDFHQSHPLKPGGRVSLENLNGSVQITGWDQATIDISGTKYGATPEMRDAVKIDVVASGDTVRIRTIRPSDRYAKVGALYVLKVPRQVALDRIITSNGSVRIEDIDGASRLVTSNGRVHAARTRGELDIQTSNGSVEIDGQEGPAVVKTSNGGVRAHDVMGRFEANTSNGAIRVEIRKPEKGRPVRLATSNGGVELTFREFSDNEVHARTSNGGITLRMPAPAGARVQAHTSNASISTDFSVTGNIVGKKNHVEGTIGSGGPLLDLATSNGSIRLQKL